MIRLSPAQAVLLAEMVAFHVPTYLPARRARTRQSLVAKGLVYGEYGIYRPTFAGNARVLLGSENAAATGARHLSWNQAVALAYVVSFGDDTKWCIEGRLERSLPPLLRLRLIKRVARDKFLATEAGRRRVLLGSVGGGR